MTTSKTTVDYHKPYEGSPAEGQFVEFLHNGVFMCGLVVESIVGHSSGRIYLEVRTSAERTVFVDWLHARACEMPADWQQRFEHN